MKSPFPKTLGACVDLCYNMRAARLEIEKQAEELKADQRVLEEHIIALLKQQEIGKAGGLVATASISTAIVPQVKDWTKFYKWIKANDGFDLLERRPSVSGYRAALEAKMKIPGVEPFTKTTLSLTKVGE